MKRKIAILIILTAAALSQPGCNASFGRFFHTDPLSPSVPNPVISFPETGTDTLTLGFDPAGDAADLPAALSYRVIYAMTDSVSTVSDCENLPKEVHSTGWQQYPESKTISLSPLMPSTAYYVNVIVKNTKGHFSLYRTAVQNTLTADSPTVSNRALTVPSITTSSAEVSFAAATDLGSLSYMLIYSTADNVGSVTDYTQLPSGVKSTAWQNYTSPVTLSSLMVNTAYYVNVIVKNDKGAFSLYDPASFTTDDANPPAVSNPLITVSNITAGTATLSFAEASDSGTLSYMVVYSTSDDVGSISNYTLLPDDAKSTVWQSYPSPASIAGLSAGTAYFVNVIVKNDKGAFSLYDSASFTTMQGPSVPENLLTLSVAADSVTVSFNKAHNESGSDDDLRYLVIYSPNDNLSSISDYSTLPTGAASSGDWQSYPSPAAVTGLSIDTKYWFNVLVRNAYGFSSYAAGSATPTDLIPPSASNTAVTAAQGSTPQTQITLKFTTGTDNVTAQGAVEYKAVLSSIKSIDQVDYANTLPSANIVQDWTAYGNTAATEITVTASGLSPYTTYYFNVLARDGHGNMSLYTCSSCATASNGTDTQSPTVSAAALSAAAGSSAGTASLSWTKAADEYKSGDVTYTSDQTLLEYRVVATTTPVTAVSETVFAAADVLTDTAGDGWTADISSLADIPVADYITTYFMVAVRDEQKNVSYYDFTSYTPSVQRDTLECYYPLNTDRTDTTGKTTTTLTGSASYSADAAFGSGSYSCSGNYLDIANTTGMQKITDNFTISLWMKTTWTDNSGTAWQEIISKGGIRGFKIQRNNQTGKLSFYITHDFNSTLKSHMTSTSLVGDGKWHHIACSFSSTGSISMYIDGAIQNGDTEYHGSGVYIDGTDSSLTRLGGNTAYSEAYTGLLNEVRIYSKVLSADEIKALGR